MGPEIESILEVRPGDFADPQVIALLDHHFRDMHANSPPGKAFALDLTALQTLDITFLTLWQDDKLLGCGALKQLSVSHAEIKSMRTHTDHLRKGVAARLRRRVHGNCASARLYAPESRDRTRRRVCGCHRALRALWFRLRRQICRLRTERFQPVFSSGSLIATLSPCLDA